MPINFNGNVTIYGDVEMYDNGSMKVTQRPPLEIDVETLINLINSNAPEEERSQLVQNARLLASADSATDESKIKDAFKSIVKFTKTVGRTILIKGISTVVAEIIKKGL